MAGRVALITFAVGLLWVVGWLAFRRIRFISRGWMIIGHGRDEIAYVEKGKGEIVIYAELMFRGSISRVVHLPRAEDWNQKVPSWAHGRRDEVVQRIKSEFPESKYEYVEENERA